MQKSLQGLRKVQLPGLIGILIFKTSRLTISAEQSAAIEANTQKRSYPETDENKLAGIEENATVGADWDTNVQNKPVTISPQQAADIEANNAKRSYPQADEDKLSGIAENATVGADWETNIANKPTTINEEQATAIEANTANVLTPKRMKPSLEELKKVLLLELIGTRIFKINLLPYRQNRQQLLRQIPKSEATPKPMKINFLA